MAKELCGWCEKPISDDLDQMGAIKPSGADGMMHGECAAEWQAWQAEQADGYAI